MNNDQCERIIPSHTATRTEELWRPVKSNDNGLQYPWLVYEGNLDRMLEQEPDVTRLSRFILEFAEDCFSDAQLKSSMWCGFPGKNVLRRATFGDRRRTYAVTTEHMQRGNKPLPTDEDYAFKGTQYDHSLPTVVAYKGLWLEHEEMGLYSLRRGVRSFDVVTSALFVFRGQPRNALTPNGVTDE